MSVTFHRDELGPISAMKLDLMFDGIRYTEALGEAAAHAYPNYYPYRFQKGEPDPTGQGKVEIPYLVTLPDETLIRVKGSFESPWHVAGDRSSGYKLINENREQTFDITIPW